MFAYEQRMALQLLNNKTKYFRLRLTYEVTLEKLGPEQTHMVTPWAPDGAKNFF